MKFIKPFILFALLAVNALVWGQLPTESKGSAASAFKTLTRPDGSTVNIVPSPDPSPTPRQPNAPGGVVSMPPALQFFVNYAAIMKPIIGYATQRLTYYTSTAGGVAPQQTAEGGDFRISCTTSHMGRFDPLVYPGRPEAGHLHTFFGNGDVNGTLTAKTLGNLANFGHSSCRGGTMNRSGYWIPTIIDINTGFPMVPTSNEAYYKNGSSYRSANPTLVQAPPAGLRMIAGSPSNVAPGGPYYWACVGGSGGSTSSPQWDHIPVDADLATTGGSCGPGGDLMLVVGFPQCWDGIHLDSPNHQSHMAHEDWYLGCNDPNYPVMIPQISFNIHWSIDRLGGSANFKNLRLSSDNYPLTSPAGYSSHGDWINGWDPTTMQMIITRCLRTHTDCHDSVLDTYGTNPYRVMY